MNASGVDLSVTIGRLTLKNPVMPASGTFGYGSEFSELVDLNELGAITVKGTTLKPRMGNPPNRFVEVAGGAFLTYVGLQNVGVKRFVSEKLPFLRSLATPVIVNVAGETVEDFTAVTEALDHAGGVSAIEVNLACPNVAGGGAAFSADARAVFDVVKAVRETTRPDRHRQGDSESGRRGFARSRCAKVPARTRSVRFGAAWAWPSISTQADRRWAPTLAAPWEGPVSSRCTCAWPTTRRPLPRCPSSGAAGSAAGRTRSSTCSAGASAVQIGSAGLIDPRAYTETIAGIRKWADDRGVTTLREVIGSAHRL